MSAEIGFSDGGAGSDGFLIQIIPLRWGHSAAAVLNVVQYGGRIGEGLERIPQVIHDDLVKG
jgi:hypothetical protein